METKRVLKTNFPPVLSQYLPVEVTVDARWDKFSVIFFSFSFPPLFIGQFRAMALGACVSQYVVTCLHVWFVLHPVSASVVTVVYPLSPPLPLLHVCFVFVYDWVCQNSSMFFSLSPSFDCVVCYTEQEATRCCSQRMCVVVVVFKTLCVGNWKCHKNWVTWLGSGIDGGTETLSARLPLSLSAGWVVILVADSPQAQPM